MIGWTNTNTKDDHLKMEDANQLTVRMPRSVSPRRLPPRAYLLEPISSETSPQNLPARADLPEPISQSLLYLPEPISFVSWSLSPKAYLPEPISLASLKPTSCLPGAYPPEPISQSLSARGSLSPWSLSIC